VGYVSVKQTYTLQTVV